MQRADITVVVGLLEAAIPVASAFTAANVELLIRLRSDDEQLANVCLALVDHVHDRHRAAAMLLQCGLLWDAEIVLRSAAEGSVKVAFFCLADREERDARMVEFSEGLDAIATIRLSERAATRLAHIPPDSPERFIFEDNVLDDAALSDLRTRWPRKERMRLNAKWSYTEMVSWIANWMREQGGSEAYKLLMHGYGISSHFIHADHLALALVGDRAARPEAERRAQEIAHGARLVTDQLAHLSIIGRGLLHANGVRSTDLSDQAVAGIRAVIAKAHALQEPFFTLVRPRRPST